MVQQKVIDGGQNSKWQYDMSWEINTSHIKEEISEMLLQQLQKLSIQEAIEIKVQLEASRRLGVSLRSTVQLNMNKWQAAIHKKVAALLEVKFCQLITRSNVCARDDQRLSKLIETVEEVDYYDLDEGMIDEDASQLKAYLLAQNLGVIEQEKQIYLIDRKALKAKINLNCFECTKRHQYGCCCGKPCAMSEKNMTVLDKHILRMEEDLKAIDKKQYETLMEKGGFLAANGEIKEFDGHCALLIAHEGVYKCMAHKYALDQGIPIYDICPLSCLMYPLEILELYTDKKKKIILITAAIEENFAENLSRWGSYKSLDVELRCINPEAHDDGFRKSEYRSVGEVNKGLLIHEFNESLYEGIYNLVNTIKE